MCIYNYFSTGLRGKVRKDEYAMKAISKFFTSQRFWYIRIELRTAMERYALNPQKQASQSVAKPSELPPQKDYHLHANRSPR